MTASAGRAWSAFLVVVVVVAGACGSSSSSPGDAAMAADLAGVVDLVAGSDAACGDTQADPAHCGACGHSCLGGTCAAGKCQPVTLATVTGYPHAIKLTTTDVYFSERRGTDPSRLVRVPIVGGTQTELSATLGLQVGEVALAGSDAFVTLYADNNIARVPQAGGGPANVVSSGTVNAPTSVLVDGTRLLFNNLNGTTISSVPIAGGAATVVATVPAQTQSLRLDGTTLYFVNFAATGKVQKTEVSGAGAGTVVDVITAQPYPFGLAVSPTHLYYTGYGNAASNGDVRRVPKAGGAVEILAPAQAHPTGIAVDDQYVYWTNLVEPTTPTANTGTVHRMPLAGGTDETIASGLGGPYAIAVDAAAVYWLNRWGGTVMKLAK